MSWCIDPDKAFDVSCKNLGCEDWCHDNSLCPIKRKDKNMYILARKEINIEKLDESEIVIHISKDGKRFSVLKHKKFKSAEGEEYHISALHNILTAGN